MIIHEILFGRFTVWACSIVLAVASLVGLYFSVVFIWLLVNGDSLNIQEM
jgi:hypothetical protein